ncbi:MAG: DUF1732 domain-containing protein [Candidatus Omnitrophica bacterium]|nr:DUF1732 domain-containing protein [Candidatus Omnitrophota bacterium]
MKSMTGYAAVHRKNKTYSVQVILRSLNFKYLDINVRNLSADDILLEEATKREIKKHIQRGKIEVFIFIEETGPKKIFIDEKTISRYIAQAKSLAKKYRIKADLSISDVLNFPQAISWEQKKKAHQGFVVFVLRQAVQELLRFKKREGLAIEKEMLFNLKKLDKNIRNIREQKPKIHDMDNGKEDIDEELSLTSFYIRKLQADIKSDKITGKGKSIDFLTQEILRELNAASSKTRKKTPSLLIVEAKNYLERIREQTQNIE